MGNPVFLVVKVGGAGEPMVQVTPRTAAVGIGIYTLLFIGLALCVYQKQDIME